MNAMILFTLKLLLDHP